MSPPPQGRFMRRLSVVIACFAFALPLSSALEAQDMPPASIEIPPPGEIQELVVRDGSRSSVPESAQSVFEKWVSPIYRTPAR